MTNRARLPSIVCDQKLADALEKYRKEQSIEICAEIDTRDALQFALMEVFRVPGEDYDWVGSEPEDNPEVIAEEDDD